jgi:hypothetical protein
MGKLDGKVAVVTGAARVVSDGLMRSGSQGRVPGWWSLT